MLVAIIAVLSLLLLFGAHHVLSKHTRLLEWIVNQTAVNAYVIAHIPAIAIPDVLLPGGNPDLTTSTAVQRIERARSIIDFSYANVGSPKPTPPPLAERLRLRALANTRLVAAFGINTSLTTSSVGLHQQFRKVASSSINKSNADWQRMYGIAVQFLKREKETHTTYFTSPVKEGDNDITYKSLHLAQVTRCMCLTVVMFSQFGFNAKKSIDRQLLVLITNETNKQWLKSKANTNVKPSVALNDALRMLLPDIIAAIPNETGTSPELTPEDVLGLIMPQYETLWRVVLLTYVTAYYRNRDRLEMARRAKGVPSCLGDVVREKEAMKIAKEGLRLYPSNNSIYRAHPDSEAYPLYKADIVCCHRDPAIWGNDTSMFRPDRFDNLTPLQERAYFPFSIGTHKCPAFGGFGNRMVAMLVVTMGRVLSPESGEVVFDDPSLDLDIESPLPTGRDDMESWRWQRGGL